MAYVFALRVAIALTPVVYRYVASGGATSPSVAAKAVEQWWHDLSDPAQDPASLSARMSAAEFENSGAWNVTDFAAPFELRKLQWRLSRQPAGGTVEDQDVCTFHFIKSTGGTPGTYNDTTDLAAVETALGTYWGAIKGNYQTWVHSDQYRWYKDGPAFYTLNGDGSAYVPLGSGNPSIRVTEIDVAGTGATPMLPPQTALTITERTSSRIHWGRWYLPATSNGTTDNDGRISSAVQTLFLSSSVSFYNSCRAASMIPVVFSIQKPVRTKKNGASLPAVGAVAYEVTSLQMDNLWDVMRSRRYRAATVKTNTALT